jgi:hypothetical protein
MGMFVFVLIVVFVVGFVTQRKHGTGGPGKTLRMPGSRKTFGKSGPSQTVHVQVQVSRPHQASSPSRPRPTVQVSETRQTSSDDGSYSLLFKGHPSPEHHNGRDHHNHHDQHHGNDHHDTHDYHSGDSGYSDHGDYGWQG